MNNLGTNTFVKESSTAFFASLTQLAQSAILTRLKSQVQVLEDAQFKGLFGFDFKKI